MTTTTERIKYVKELVNSGFKFEEKEAQKIIFELFGTCFEVIDKLEQQLKEKNAILNLLKTASELVESVELKTTKTNTS